MRKGVAGPWVTVGRPPCGAWCAGHEDARSLTPFLTPFRDPGLIW